MTRKGNGRRRTAQCVYITGIAGLANAPAKLKEWTFLRFNGYNPIWLWCLSFHDGTLYRTKLEPADSEATSLPTTASMVTPEVICAPVVRAAVGREGHCDTVLMVAPHLSPLNDFLANLAFPTPCSHKERAQGVLLLRLLLCLLPHFEPVALFVVRRHV